MKDEATAITKVARRGSPEFRAKISAALKGRRSSPATEFKKGHHPWNKGRKGIHLAPATEFKKFCLLGQAARNYKATGTVVVRKEHNGCKRRFLKVDDIINGQQNNWRPLSHCLYLEFKGQIPPGHFVVHADGNTLNDKLDNLILMNRRDLLAWQRTIRPKMEIKRKAKSAKSQELRWRIYRAKKTQRIAVGWTGTDA